MASAWLQLGYSSINLNRTGLRLMDFCYDGWTDLNRTGLRLMDFCYDGWTDRVPQMAPTSTHFLKVENAFDGRRRRMKLRITLRITLVLRRMDTIAITSRLESNFASLSIGRRFSSCRRESIRSVKLHIKNAFIYSLPSKKAVIYSSYQRIECRRHRYRTK